MMQSALLEIESSAYAVEPGEDEHRNPNIFGKALAQWLAEQPRSQGLPAGEIIAEDFSWCVPVESKPHSLYVACVSTEEGQTHWRVFAFADGGCGEGAGVPERHDLAAALGGSGATMRAL